MNFKLVVKNMKKVKNLFKKFGHAYKEGFILMYSPAIKYGISINM